MFKQVHFVILGIVINWDMLDIKYIINQNIEIKANLHAIPN